MKKKPYRPPAPTVGEKIRAARESGNWSQTEFAAALEIHKDHLSKLERGERQPSRGLLLLVASLTLRFDLFPPVRPLEKNS